MKIGEKRQLIGHPTSWHVTTYVIERIAKAGYLIYQTVRFPRGPKRVSSMSEVRKVVEQYW